MSGRTGIGVQIFHLFLLLCLSVKYTEVKHAFVLKDTAINIESFS